jgi:uncharacterized protein GlcG (DUF336 family)
VSDAIVADSASLTLAGATRVLEAALAKADSMGKKFCITVTDATGEPLTTARMDGAPRLAAGIATNKAFSVCGFSGMPTAAWWDAIKDDGALVHGITHTPRLVVFGGGVPVVVAGRLVGAIGVSGGSTEEDTAVAEAGARAVAGFSDEHRAD